MISDEKNLFPEDYKYALKEFIRECNTPITISLQGEWGSGKTTLVDEIADSFCNDVNSNVFFLKPYINAWELSQFNMDSQLPFLVMSKIINSIDNGVKVPFVVKNALKLTGNFISGTVFNNNHGVDDLFLKNHFEQLETLKVNFKKAVDKRLKNENKKNGRIVIFIDDLDRISPKKAIEVLECLKNFMQTDRCVFILAIDYDVVIKGAEEKYGLDKGKVFFDKIIQLPFTMPTEFYDVPEYLTKKLINIQNLIGEKYYFLNFDDKDDENNTVKLYNKILKHTVGTNPRTINRIFNLFYLMIKADIKNYEMGFKKNIEKNINIGKYETKFYNYYFLQICIKDKYPALWHYILKSLAEAFKQINVVKLDRNFSGIEKKEIDSLIQDIFNGYSCSFNSNEKIVLNIYCKLLKNINNSVKLGNRNVFQTVAIFRNIDGYLNI